jgi:esterase
MDGRRIIRNSYETMKEDLAVFFDQHQLEQAVIMGHSMGGKTAMLFAADYPEKVKNLL